MWIPLKAKTLTKSVEYRVFLKFQREVENLNGSTLHETFLMKSFQYRSDEK